MGLSPLGFSRLKIPQGHILIIGPTGAGKTNTAKVLVEECIERGLDILVLDWHGEYRGLARYIPGENLSMNLLGGTSPVNDAEFIVDLLSQVFQLSEPQWYLLQKSFRDVKVETLKLSQLVEAVEEQPARDYKEYEIKAALLRRLSLLNDGLLGQVLNGDTSPYFLFERSAIVDLSPLPLKYRGLLALVILKHLYDYAVFNRGITDEMTHATLLEEAWNIIPYRARWEPPTIGERLFLEIRKFGEMLIGVSQRLDDLSERVIRNAQLILLHSPSSQDLQKIGVPREFNDSVTLKAKRGLVYAVYPDGIKIVRVRRSKFL